MWNPITGCTPASEGCENCYAKAIHSRFGKTPFSDIVFHRERLDAPLGRKKPAVIFVNSMGDLFHEDVNTLDRKDVYSIIKQAYWHKFIILTKRHKEMLEWQKNSYLQYRYGPLQNLWLGVSVENDKHRDRIEKLIETPAAHRVLSIEPMLSEIVINPIYLADIDWVICGPETGPRARYFDERWAIDLRDQCRECGIPFFYKANDGNLGGERCREWPTNLKG